MPAKSFAERIDPGGEFGKKTREMPTLVRSPLASVLRLLGVEQKTLDQGRQIAETFQQLVSEPDRIAGALGPLGWVFHGLADFEAHRAAATLVEEGKVEEAERLLVASYNEKDYASIRFYNRVTSLYQGNESRNRIGLERQRLLDQAYELHKEEHYAAAIPLLLAQIDGIFIDMTGRPAKTFYDPRNPNLVDHITIAGHPLGLKALSELMSREQRKTVLSDTLTRQGILHGRVLGYDSLMNATKTWAALLAVIEAVGPGADRLNKEAAGDNEP